MKDITQGYDNVAPYEEAPVGHAGGTIGPYANKISDGKFVLDGKDYSLECNKDNGKSHSHGGTQGFDTKNWKANILKDGIEFTYEKKDMESGYPGNVKASVIYKFDNDNNLHIKYSAKSDKDTIINMTNHTYFNLDGAENTQENSVYEHIVALPNSSSYTVNSDIAIPTGEIVSVKNTPFDFSSPKKIGDVIESDNEQIKIGSGFDQNYCVDNYDGKSLIDVANIKSSKTGINLKVSTIESDNEQIKIGSGFDQNYCVDNYDGKSLIDVANIKSSKTGINLKVSTNLPGFQFYTANHLGKSAQPNGKSGARYEKRSSFCVEPQFYPNAINIDDFNEKGILKSGEEYNREIVYSFYTEN